MAAAAQVGRGLRVVALACILSASLSATTFYVTVAGLGGEPDYEQRFAMEASEIDKSLKLGTGNDVQTLHGAGATKAAVRGAFEKVARDAKTQDALVVMLIGHGTFDGAEYKFNLPGPDLSATELAAMLDKIHAGRELIVNMTSASGGSVATLRSANRVIIAATRSGSEKNATVFPRFWVEALRDPSVDIDKNETISAMEAFKFAEAKTKQFYEEQKRLSTEHALMDNESKAAAFPVVRLGTALALTDPAKLQLVAKKNEIEGKIDQLKYQKSLMPPDEYRKQIAGLLLELAKTQEEIEK